MNGLDKAILVFSIVFIVLSVFIYRIKNMPIDMSPNGFIPPMPIVKNESVPRFSPYKKNLIFVAYVVLIVLTILMAASKRKAIKIIGVILLITTLLFPIVLMIANQYSPAVRNWVSKHSTIKTIVDKLMDGLRSMRGKWNILLHGMPKAPYS